MPIIATTTHYQKPRKNKAVLLPPIRKKVTRSAGNVKPHWFEREKSQLFAIIDADLNALFDANQPAEVYTLDDIEKAHDMFVATGLYYRILMSKRR